MKEDESSMRCSGREGEGERARERRGGVSDAWSNALTPLQKRIPVLPAVGRVRSDARHGHAVRLGLRWMNSAGGWTHGKVGMRAECQVCQSVPSQSDSENKLDHDHACVMEFSHHCNAEFMGETAQRWHPVIFSYQQLATTFIEQPQQLPHIPLHTSCLVSRLLSSRVTTPSLTARLHACAPCKLNSPPSHLARCWWSSAATRDRTCELSPMRQHRRTSTRHPWLSRPPLPSSQEAPAW